MADYNEHDERSYLAHNTDKLVRGLSQIRRGLSDIAMLKVDLEFVPPTDHPLAEQHRGQQSIHHTANGLLLGDKLPTCSIEAVETGSIEAIQQQIDHLRQIGQVEEAFPGQQG